MTTTTAWAHLPNAKHIDAVLADVNTRPEVWKAAWDAARQAALDAARPAALDAARPAALDAARPAALDAARQAARAAAWAATWDAVWDVIRALVAWDSAADLVDLPPDVLRTMADRPLPGLR